MTEFLIRTIDQARRSDSLAIHAFALSRRCLGLLETGAA